LRGGLIEKSLSSSEGEKKSRKNQKKEGLPGGEQKKENRVSRFV